jgi:hypothetical protein
MEAVAHNLGIIPEFSEGTRKNQKILNENTDLQDKFRKRNLPNRRQNKAFSNKKSNPLPRHKGI